MDQQVVEKTPSIWTTTISMRLRFSIKHVFFAVLIAALLAAVLGSRYHFFQRQHAVVGKLKELGGDVELSFVASTAWWDSPLRMLFDESILSNGDVLELYDSKDGSIGPEHFEQLEALPRLRCLCMDLDGWDQPPFSPAEESKMVDQIIDMPHLKSVSFGVHNISMASYDRLIESGLLVSHLGLSDFQLKKNFIRLGKNDAFIDLDKSSLEFIIDTDRNQASWWIELRCKGGRYVSEYYDHNGLDAMLEIPKQVGETIQISEAKSFDDLVNNTFWCCMGNQHCSPCDIHVGLVSQTGHSRHLDFNFVDAYIKSDFLEPEKQSRVRVNAELEVKSIVVQFGSETEINLEQAKKLIEEHGLNLGHYYVDENSSNVRLKSQSTMTPVRPMLRFIRAK